jgi:cystathionine beta-synthase
MSPNQSSPQICGIATPLTESTLGSLSILLKREEFNPSGSHKDRPTKLISSVMRHNGKFRPVGGKRPVFVVPSSGNFGHGFAYHTQDDDIEVVIITDVLSSPESQDTLRQYSHVTLEVVDHPDETGSHVEERMRRLDDVCKHRKQLGHEVAVVNQYCERCVPLAYELSLAREIDVQTDGQVGMIVLPVGTGGLLNGILKYAKKHHRHWTVVAADARGSRLFHDSAGCKRHFPGYGNGQPTALIGEISQSPYAFNVVHVDDQHAALACPRMLLRNNLLFGPSGGACIGAIETVLRFHPDLVPHVGHIVAIIPDSGRNYLSTLYCEEWLMANDLGKVVGYVSV